jgi:hypothetical protein
MIAAILIEEHNLASPKIRELQKLMVGDFLLDSKCSKYLKEKFFMLKLLKFVPLTATLLYRASDHGE